MNRWFALVAMFCVLAGHAFAQYPHVTIREIQQVPLDSLLRADTLQNTVPSRWVLQTSPYRNDTVTVTVLCYVPAKVLTFTQSGFTMMLIDTGANWFPWGGIFVRASSDTGSHILDNFLNVERGDVIQMTGVVTEFPTNSMNSVTQFQPIPGIPIQIIGSAPVPGPIKKEVGDFYRGLFPGGRVRYSTGEPFEGLPVLFTDLTVDARVNTARGTFSAVDEFGNQITTYDASRFFTLGHGTFLADSVWAIRYPVVGSRIDSIRGQITTVSGNENPRGYRISPIFRGDVVVGITLPSVTTHRRNPIIVPSDSAARISAVVRQLQGGFPIASAQLIYSLNNGPYISLPMTFQPTDSTYQAQIPNQPENTFVHYFIKATDNQNNSTLLASSAIGGASRDTSKGFFFYTVLNRPLTIHDIQYTPYSNGRSAYLGANTSVSGIVTADTAYLRISPLNTAGTNAWYMQSGNDPWSGLWITGTEQTMGLLRNGDSITVNGFVAEQFDVTRLQNIAAPVTIHSSSNPIPTPVGVPTSTFGPTVGNGTPSAERYEGMLVRFNDVTVSSIDPVFADPTEFEVDDGSGPVLVRRDGKHSFSNVPADSNFGFTILRLGNRISHLTGIIYYSFNRYKIVPRTNNDFGTITNSVPWDHDPTVPQQYSLEQNYPNPFNPSTTIQYALPRAGFVTLKLYNILGQEVKALINEMQDAGTYTLRMDASSLPTGVYFYRVQAGEFSRAKKMMLLK